jgi:hypothetical protein
VRLQFKEKDNAVVDEELGFGLTLKSPLRQPAVALKQY